MLTGRCLCGAVCYEIAGTLGPIACCHCVECRRASGAAFATNANAKAAEHRFTQGKDAIVEYESSPGKVRAFCAKCGSPLYSRTTKEPDVIRIRLGTLDQDPGGRPRLHVWTAEQAPWCPQLAEDLPRIERI